MFADMCRVALALATPLVVGWPIVSLLFAREPMCCLHRAALSWVLGSGMFAWMAFLYVYLGGRFALAALLGLVAPFAGATAVLWIVALCRAPARGGGWRRGPGWLGAGLLLATCAAICVVTATALVKPVYRWDSVMFWVPKAKMLFHEGTVHTGFWADPGFIHIKRERPLLIPIVEAWVFACLGRIDEQLVKAVFPVYFLCLLVVTYYELRRHTAGSTALAATALLATVPAMICERTGKVPATWEGYPEALTMQTAAASTSYTDLPLALYLTCGVMLLVVGLGCGRWPYFAAAGVALGAAVFTKPEGLVYVVLLGIAVLIAAARGMPLGRRGAALCGLALLSPVAMNLPWFAFRSGLPTVFNHDVYSVLGIEPERLPVILAGIVRELLSVANWGLLWVLTAAIAVSRWENLRFGPLQVVAWFLVLFGIFLCAAFLCYRGDVLWLMEVSLSRLLMHCAPAAVFLVAAVTATGGCGRRRSAVIRGERADC